MLQWAFCSGKVRPCASAQRPLVELSVARARVAAVSLPHFLPCARNSVVQYQAVGRTFSLLHQKMSQQPPRGMQNSPAAGGTNSNGFNPPTGPSAGRNWNANFGRPRRGGFAPRGRVWSSSSNGRQYPAGNSGGSQPSWGQNTAGHGGDSRRGGNASQVEMQRLTWVAVPVSRLPIMVPTQRQIASIHTTQNFLPLSPLLHSPFGTTTMTEHPYKTTSNLGLCKPDMVLAIKAMDANDGAEQYVESTGIDAQIKALEARKQLRDKGDGTHELVAGRMLVDFLCQIGEGVKKFGDERKAVIDRQDGKFRNFRLFALLFLMLTPLRPTPAQHPRKRAAKARLPLAPGFEHSRKRGASTKLPLPPTLEYRHGPHCGG